MQFLYCNDAPVCMSSLTNGWLAMASCFGPVQKLVRNPASRVYSCMTVFAASRSVALDVLAKDNDPLASADAYV